MKLTTIFLIVSLCQVHANSYSQKTKLSLDLEDASIGQIFIRIEEISEFRFMFETGRIDLDRKVSLKVSMKKISDVLPLLFAGTDVAYKVRGRQVILTKKGLGVSLPKADALDSVSNKKTVLQQQVSGTVTDAEGVPLAGANIVEKSTTNGTQTDFDGNFSIEVGEDAVLVISYIGFAAKEVNVDGQSNISVSLAEDAAGLDEVVVIGYGSVKKSDLTGAVSSIKAEDLTPGANISLEQTLQGRAAGVQISQKGGEPGAAMSINIRGASSIDAGNDPLYVIDGVPVNNAPVAGGGGSGLVQNQNARNPLNALNPQDIASIEILKDASSTAIYGARGSNGVVLITTKSGKSGKLKINYDTSTGWQSSANTLELLNAMEYREVLNAIIDDGGGNENVRVAEFQGSGTDWQSQLLRNASVETHNLGFSGGNENITYYASLNYFNQDGIIKNSGITRYNARINISVKEEEKYAFGINLNSGFIEDNFASNGVGINAEGGALYAAINYDPTARILDDEGDFFLSPFLTPELDNPLALLNGESIKAETSRTFGNIYGEYFLMPSLSVKAKLGADINNARRDVFISPITQTGNGQGGIANILTGRRDYYLTEATLNYNKEFDDDNVSAVLGTTYEYFASRNFSGNARGFALPDLGTNAIGSGDPVQNQISSGLQTASFISYLGRVNYSLNNKYLFTASMRADGSSRFGPSNKWGYFPSGAVAWKMHEEPFLANSSTINEFKLRASYGSIGNANISNYLYLPSFNVGQNVILGSDRFNTINPSRLANPDLKWESANQLDVGVDFGLFNNRLSGTLDYYNRKTEDLLLNVPIPSNTGFASRVENIGSVENYGVEISLTGKIISTKNFGWETNFNLTTITNNVLDIGAPESILTGGFGFVSNATITRPGDPMFSFYGYEVDGVWQTADNIPETFNAVPGDLKYRDISGPEGVPDGVINADDRTIIGKPFPDYTWGLTNNFRYKNFNLSVFFEGVEGISTLNNNLVDTYFPISFRRNRIAEPYLNRWTPNNPTNEYPSFVNTSGTTTVNTKTVEDSSFIRLQSVSFSYDVPMGNVNAIDRLSISLTGQNLWTLTDYSGTDPAANAAGSSVLRIDYNTYPFARTITLGLNVQL